MKNNLNIPVVILCGGKGTRAGQITAKIPKPLIKIGNRPILWHVMKIYSRFGFNDFILCLLIAHRLNFISKWKKLFLQK